MHSAHESRAEASALTMIDKPIIAIVETQRLQMHQYLYVIGVGSNLGDRLEIIHQARRYISQLDIDILEQSSILETAPEGGIADRQFLNAAWLCACNDAPRAMLLKLQSIELKLGRNRDQRWANRTLDLDILLWKHHNDSLEQPSRRFTDDMLMIPHPRLLDRRFALQPAAEIAPDWIHPDSLRRLRDENTKSMANGSLDLQLASCQRSIQPIRLNELSMRTTFDNPAISKD